MHHSDVLVLGAGMAGLMAAAYLVKAGLSVCVLEKAATVGGSAGYYRRRGLTFPTGATLAFGLEEGGLLRELLDDVDVHPDTRSLTHPMDVLLPDRTMPIWQEQSDFETALTRVFYERPTAVVKAWRDLCRLADDVLAISATRPALPVRRLSDLGHLPALLLRHPEIALRVGSRRLHTVQDWLVAHHVADFTPFVQFINAQLLDSVQTDARNAALLPASVALTIYRKGSFALTGGFGALAEALALRIRNDGGQTRLSCRVERIGRASLDDSFEVHTRKGVYSASRIIDATGTPANLFELGDMRQRIHGRASTAAEIATKWGALRLDAVYVGKLETLDALPFAYQIVPTREHAALFEDVHGAVYVTVHPPAPFGRELALSPAGYPVTVSVHTQANTWMALEKTAYDARKQQVRRALLAECERVLPEAATRLSACFIGTPRTYLTYIGKETVGGGALTVARAIRRPSGYRTPALNYYRAGEETFPGPGTLSAALSGYYAARGLLADAKRRV